MFYRFAGKQEFEDLCSKQGLDAAAHYRFMQKLLSYASPKKRALPASSSKGSAPDVVSNLRSGGSSSDSNMVLIDDDVMSEPSNDSSSGASSGSDDNDIVILDDE